MLSNIQKKINNREYILVLNEKKINISTRRIKNIKEFYEFLIKPFKLKNDSTFFIYKYDIFFSIGLPNNVDLVWVSDEEVIINIEKNFSKNKISKKVENTKFLYILPSGFVDRKNISMNDKLTHLYVRKKIKDGNFLKK